MLGGLASVIDDAYKGVSRLNLSNGDRAAWDEDYRRARSNVTSNSYKTGFISRANARMGRPNWDRLLDELEHERVMSESMRKTIINDNLNKGYIASNAKVAALKQEVTDLKQQIKDATGTIEENSNRHKDELDRLNEQLSGAIASVEEKEKLVMAQAKDINELKRQLELNAVVKTTAAAMAAEQAQADLTKQSEQIAELVELKERTLELKERVDPPRDPKDVPVNERAREYVGLSKIARADFMSKIELIELGKILELVRKENSSLKEQLILAKQELNEYKFSSEVDLQQINEDLTQARDEIASLTQQLTEAKNSTELERAREEIATLTEQLDRAREEIVTPTQASSSVELEQAREEIATLTQQLAQASSSTELAQAREEIATLPSKSAELAQAREEIATLTQRLTELADAREKIVELTNSHEEVAKQLTVAQEHVKKLEKDKAQLEEYRNAKYKVDQLEKQYEEKLIEFKEDANAKIAEAEAQVAEEQNNVRSLKEVIADITQKYSERSDKPELVRQREEIMESLDQYSDVVFDEQKQVVIDDSSWLDEKDAIMAGMQTQAKKIAQLERAVNAGKTTIDKLTEENAVSAEIISSYEDIYKEHESKIKDLNRENRELSEKNFDLDQEIEHLKQQIAKAEANPAVSKEEVIRLSEVANRKIIELVGVDINQLETVDLRIVLKLIEKFLDIHKKYANLQEEHKQVLATLKDVGDVEVAREMAEKRLANMKQQLEDSEANNERLREGIMSQLHNLDQMDLVARAQGQDENTELVDVVSRAEQLKERRLAIVKYVKGNGKRLVEEMTEDASNALNELENLLVFISNGEHARNYMYQCREAYDSSEPPTVSKTFKSMFEQFAYYCRGFNAPIDLKNTDDPYYKYFGQILAGQSIEQKSIIQIDLSKVEPVEDPLSWNVFLADLWPEYFSVSGGANVTNTRKHTGKLIALGIVVLVIIIAIILLFATKKNDSSASPEPEKIRDEVMKNISNEEDPPELAGGFPSTQTIHKIYPIDPTSGEIALYG